MQCQLTTYTALERLFAVSVIVNSNDVVALTDSDSCRTGNSVDIDNIVRSIGHRYFVTSIDKGHTGMG